MATIENNKNNIRFAQDRLKFTLYFAPVLVILFITLSVVNSSPNYFAPLFWIPYAFFMSIAAIVAYNKLYKFKYAIQFSDDGIILSDGIFLYDAIKWNEINRLKKHTPFINTYILLFVDNYKIHAENQPLFKRLQMQWYVLRFKTPFVINVEALEFMYDRVANRIKEELLAHNDGLIISEKFPFDIERI